MGDRRPQDIQWLQSRIEVLERHIDQQYIARSILEKENEMLSYRNQVMRYEIYNADKSVQDQLADYTQKPKRQTSPKRTGGQTINFTRSKKREEAVKRIATLRSLYNFPK